MLSKAISQALNEQIENELFAAYMYLSLYAYFTEQNLHGFAHWMRLQSQEETDHAMRLIDYIHERDGKVRLGAIEQPPSDFTSPLAVFEKALEHEQKVTGMIHDLYGVALQEKDYPTQIQLQWFISEQVEEEASAGEVVDRLRTFGQEGAALLMLDQELGSRGAEA